MKFLFLFFEVDDWSRALVARGNGGHVAQDSRDFVQLWNLSLRHVPNCRPEVLILKADQPCPQMGEAIEYKFIDVNGSTILELAGHSICTLPRSASQLLENRAANGLRNLPKHAINQGVVDGRWREIGEFQTAA